MGRVGKRTIVCGPCGISRRSEAVKGIYSCFPSADPASTVQVPNLGLGYRERKSMELKLTEIALNRFGSKNHIGERTTDKGVQVGIFLLKICCYF